MVQRDNSLRQRALYLGAAILMFPCGVVAAGIVIHDNHPARLASLRP